MSKHYLKSLAAALISFLIISMFIPTQTFAADGDECQHVWGEWETIVDATCVSDGSAWRKCNSCGEYESKVLPATGVHVWGKWHTEASEPTCGEKGYKIRYCEDCDKYQKKVLPATGKHDWDAWETTKRATVFKKGTQTRYCDTCGKKETRSTNKVKPFAKFKNKKYSVTAGKTAAMKSRLKFGRGDKVTKWKVSNKNIASISKSGKLKAKKKGTVTVTAVLKSGKKATCKITVKAVKKKKPSKETSASGTVYWTPGGSVYHVSRNCPTLSRSKVVKSGTIKQSGKHRCCKVCG